MFTTLSLHLFAAFQLLLPLYLVQRLWRLDVRTSGAWLLEALHAAGALALLFLMGRWDVVGYPLRYGLYGLRLGGVALSWVRVRGLPSRRDGATAWRGMAALELALFTGALVWVGVSLPPESRTVEVRPPLEGGRHIVVQGGATPVTNYHGLFAEPQTWALDIVRLDGWGVRASGVLPDDPRSYAIFGDTVRSPLSGRVVDVVDSLPDQTPPETLASRPAGNHVWIRRDSVHLLLAHLQHGSVRVDEGERVEAGQPVARVGNTGNTSEPHLHLHAVIFPGGAPDADSLLRGGKPVPLSFGDGPLLRNSAFGDGPPGAQGG